MTFDRTYGDPNDSLTDWPDTSGEKAPVGDPYKSATWLLGRHAQLAETVARCSCVVHRHDGQLDLDLSLLEEGVLTLLGAMDGKEPQFPRSTAGQIAREIAAMSPGDRVSLTLLAGFSTGITLRASGFPRDDPAGQRFLEDWAIASVTA